MSTREVVECVLEGDLVKAVHRLMEFYNVGSLEELIRRLIKEKYDELTSSHGQRLSASHISR